MATPFSLSLVARVPQESGPPELVEVDRLVTEKFSYVDELNRPGSAGLSCPIKSMSADVKARLRNLRSFPSEVWIYTGTTLAWAGEVQTVAIQGQSVQLNAAGLLGYTFRMGVTEDLVYAADDQFAIGKALVDHWQDLEYGNYGLDTSGIGTSGVVRDRTYLQADLHNIGTRLQELGEVANGFDIHVEPATRALVFSYPRRGLDLTASVFLDKRNIDSAATATSVGPDDLASDGGFTGTSQDADGAGSTLYAARSNEELRETYGRSWSSANFDGVSEEDTLEEHGDAYLDARSEQFFQPGVTVVPRIGCQPGDVRAGDTVSYAYDAGLGLQEGQYRLGKVTVRVEQNGDQRMGMEFV